MSIELHAPPEFSTARLRLRKPKLSDAGALFDAYTNDQEVVRFLTWKAHRSQDDTEAFLQICLDQWAGRNSYPFVIEALYSEDGPIGMIDLRRRPEGVEFGYVLAQPYWGKGYMAEALATLVDWSLAQPNIWRASAVCDIDNLASAKVMEKAGMDFEGILRRYLVHTNISDEPRDCRLYAKVRH